jgi:uroporphyrinogen III methyltransferase/synthase
VGTTTEQKTVVSTLDNVAADVRAARIAPPAVVVVGEVVTMRDALSWFETKPLFGWRVLVPRTKEQAGSLSVSLRGFGAVPEEVPTISVEPPATRSRWTRPCGLAEAATRDRLHQRNAVKAVREKFESTGSTPALPGSRSRRSVTRPLPRSVMGPAGRLVPSGEQSAGSRGLAGVRRDLDPINRACPADIATENLVRARRPGLSDDVTAYRTVRGPAAGAATRSRVVSSTPSPTSSSTVRNLVGIRQATPLDGDRGDRPATAKTAEEMAVVDVHPPKPDVDELVDALADFVPRAPRC